MSEAGGAYDFRIGRKLRCLVEQSGLNTIVGEDDWYDRELNFQGPAGPEIARNWETRLARMIAPKAFFGFRYDDFCRAFMKEITANRIRPAAVFGSLWGGGGRRVEMNIRFAQKADVPFLGCNDTHVTEKTLVRKIDDRQILIAENEGVPVGWLRFGFFWDEIPFANLLYILSPFRGCGFGKALMAAWEDEMQKEGFSIFMTSTQDNETAQHFFRKLGYRDAGGFMPADEAYELMMIKETR